MQNTFYRVVKAMVVISGFELIVTNVKIVKTIVSFCFFWLSTIFRDMGFFIIFVIDN